MVNEGPTNVATLKATFTGDISEVITKMEAVKAAATELGATDVDIKIDSKNADKATAAMMRTEAAQRALVTADDQLFASNKKVNDENDRGIKRWQAIALAVVALIPLLGPLLGYSVAIAGAMTTMGLAGIAAIFGIKQAMAEGNEVGNSYAVGIQMLKRDLDALGQTAAVAMLGSYEQVIGNIEDHMPELTRDTGLFATQLGNAGVFITNGVLNGLQALLPLLLTGGVYVERIGMGFQAWAENGGLQKFGAYALNVLPQVSATLATLIDFIGDVVIAAAPWGSVMLTAIRTVAQVLDTFPLPVLGAIAAGAIAGYGAFRLWNGVTAGVDAVRGAIDAVSVAIKAQLPLTAAEIAANNQLVTFMSLEAGVAEAVAAGQKEVAVTTTAMGTAMDFASGPVGIVFAALGALAAIISVVVASQTENTDVMNDYTAAVEQDSGAIGANTRQQAANNLQKSGAASAARDLGVTLKTLTDASLGSSSAQQTLTDRVKQTKAAYDLASQIAARTTDEKYKEAFATEQLAKKHYDEATAAQNAANSEETSIKKTIKAYNDLQDALGGTHIKTQAQFDAQVALANQYGLSLPSFVTATDASKKHADQTAATTNELRMESNAAMLLKNSLDLLNGKALDVAQAQTGVAAATNSLVDSFKQNKDQIDGNSKAAVANQQALQAVVQSAQQYAEAIGTQTGSSEKARQALVDQKTALENTLQSQGLLTDGVKAYIDQIFQIPASLPPTKLDVDNAQATAKLLAYQALLNQIDGREIVNNVRANTPGLLPIGPRVATGGTIGHFAEGGAAGTVYGPGSTTSDSVPAWLSVGEEVIKASSAAQFRPFLKAFNKDPKSAMSGLAAATASPPIHRSSHLHIDGTGYSPEALFSEFNRRENLRNQ